MLATMDPVGLRAALEQQARMLRPLVDATAAAVAHPPQVSHDDWRGAARRACDARHAELLERLRDAAAVLDEALAATRQAIAGLP